MSIQHFPGVKITFDNLPSPVNTFSSGPVPTDTLILPPECNLSPDQLKQLDSDSDWTSKIAKVRDREYLKNLDQINDVIKSQVESTTSQPDQIVTQPAELDDKTKACDLNKELPQTNADKNVATSQFAKEHGMTDEQLYNTIKANEESVAGNKKVVWVSAVLADEIQHRIDEIKKAFDKMISTESSWFTDRNKVKISENCDALIAVDPFMLETFIKNFKYDAKRSEDMVACVPEKPVEVPIHPQHNVTSSIKKTEKPVTDGFVDPIKKVRTESLDEWKTTYGDPDSAEFSAKNEPLTDENSTNWDSAKMKYESGECKLTPDGIKEIVNGNAPIIGAYHEGIDAVGPVITREQYMKDIEDIASINKSFKIPGAKPFDQANVNWFTDDYKRLNKAKSTPTPPPNKPIAWTADGHPFDCGNNYGRSEQAKVEKKAPLIPRVYDVPKDMVDMIEKLPNDLWRYNVVQDTNGIKLILNYDARPRHIHIIVNTEAEEVTINTNREFRGSYSTTLSWNSSTADDILCPNRQRLFRWLRAWIKDIME